MRRKKRRDWLKLQAQVQTDWLLFEQDECWFSRFAQPQVHAWAVEGQALRLVEHEASPHTSQKAVACYGAVRQDTEQVYLYFCDGQPQSSQTLAFLPGLLNIARQEDKKVMVLIWDNATWHKSQKVRRWVREYNRQAKRTSEVRLLVFRLPTKSPWLNSIEPRWIHAKRKVCEPDGELTPDELKRRLAAHFDTTPFPSPVAGTGSVSALES
jgi:transposase